MGKGVGDVAERNLSNSGFFVIPIRIDGLASYCEDDIALAEAGLFGSAPRSNFGDVDPVLLETDVAAKLRIPGRGEDQPRARKARISCELGIVEKVGNYRRAITSAV